MMLTSVQVAAADWVDEDRPLWYQVKYQVVGKAGEAAALSEFSPSATWSGYVPEAGLPQHNYLVTIQLLVRDALGAVSSAARNITVERPSLEGSGQQDEFVDGLLGSSGDLLKNGDAEAVLVSVKGLTSVLNTASEDRKRRRLRRRLLQVSPTDLNKQRTNT